MDLCRWVLSPTFCIIFAPSWGSLSHPIALSHSVARGHCAPLLPSVPNFSVPPPAVPSGPSHFSSIITRGPPPPDPLPPQSFVPSTSTPLPPSITFPRSSTLFARRSQRYMAGTIRPLPRLPLLSLPSSFSSAPTYLPRAPYFPPPPFIPSTMFPYPIPPRPIPPPCTSGVDTPHSPDRTSVIDLTRSPTPPPTLIPTSLASVEYDHRLPTRGLASMSPLRSTLAFQRHFDHLIQDAFHPSGPFSTPPIESSPNITSSPPHFNSDGSTSGTPEYSPY